MITQVTNNLYRGPRIETCGNVEQLKSIGINVILNLEEAEESSAEDIDVIEKRMPGTLFRCYPMSEFTRPSADKLRYIVISINNFQGLQKKIYVHCKHGQDRTGYVIAAYRMIVEGWTFEQAYKECLDMGHKAWFYDFFPLF